MREARHARRKGTESIGNDGKNAGGAGRFDELSDNIAFSDILPGMTSFLRTFAGRAMATCLLATLLACTPKYDWRVVQSIDGGYSVTYPAKPHADTRQVALGGEKLPMTMQAAQVGDAWFAVGVVTLPRDDDASRSAVLAAMQHGLLANLGGAAPHTTAVSVQTAAAGLQVPGVAVVAEGHAVPDKSARYVSARFVAYGKHVYQIVVLAPKAPPPDQVEQFMTSFTLIG